MIPATSAAISAQQSAISDPFDRVERRTSYPLDGVSNLADVSHREIENTQKAISQLCRPQNLVLDNGLANHLQAGKLDQQQRHKVDIKLPNRL